jgi:ferric-dicitrate binding protein FerR (iron transport regulator)
MSTSVPPRDSATLSGSHSLLTPFLADESALRRVFDAEYGAYLASARSQLNDAATQAPRVVETAFVSAWTRRAEFGTHDQLAVFLADEVHHGATRALSRKAAAHRFGTHGGRDGTQSAAHASTDAMDANASWVQIDKAIHADPAGVDAHAAAAAAGRHEAAEHMKSIAKRPSWVIPLAIGVAAIAVSVAGVLMANRLGENDAVFGAVSNAGINPIASQAGQIGSLTLADGTKLRIGPETKIFIPDAFPKKMRAVRVEGTAQFDVAPNQPLPFHVVAKRTLVTATGTSFIVSAYPGDSVVLVQVRQGGVTVTSGKQSSGVAANQSLFTDRSVQRAPTAEESAQAFGWVDGHIVVAHRQLRDVIGQLTRWFNLDIKVPELKLLDREVSLNVSLDSSRAAISQVEKSGNVKFAYEGETKVFRDATPRK